MSKVREPNSHATDAVRYALIGACDQSPCPFDNYTDGDWLDFAGSNTDDWIIEFLDICLQLHLSGRV